MKKKLNRERREEFLRFRIFLPALISLLFLLVLIGRLYLEQVRSGDKHRKQVSRQSMRQIRIPPQRGMIYTSDLKQLTDNLSAFELLFYPGEMRKRKRSKTRAVSESSTQNTPTTSTATRPIFPRISP